jgi:hypothetical protein
LALQLFVSDAVLSIHHVSAAVVRLDEAPREIIAEISECADAARLAARRGAADVAYVSTV